MKYMTVNQLRESFLSFFESKGHLRLKSYPLIPDNDKSLLLINSGMAPMKSYFTGLEAPPSKRVTTCQKCIRTIDVDNVGKTARHGTFFEMLGNFSFGDYFKEEVIPWSWEYCVKILEIPEERLFVSVYENDDEALGIWHEKVGLPREKIFKLGKEDNFWEVGTGPCGPCSEIYFDRGPEYGCGKESCAVGCDCDRYMEIWNLVFTQFSKEDDGSYSNLKNPNIDTGMGLERLAVAMQGVESLFDVDSVKAIRDEICKAANVKYGENPDKDISIRVITDHMRSVSFMLADGVLPNNEGRGYVLRRLLRRAARHGRLLGIEGMFLSQICSVVIEESKEAYPELWEKSEYILKILSLEENRFNETLSQGLELLKGFVEKMKSEGESVLAGSNAFRLYDTFGFPLELMKEILAEEELQVDEDAFAEEMNKQKENSRSNREENTFMGGAENVYSHLDPNEYTEFVGYNDYSLEGVKVTALISGDMVVEIAREGEEVSIILDKTPFYATGGGQIADFGTIETKNGQVEINDCIRVMGNKFAHMGVVTKGEIFSGETVSAHIDKARRLSIARNHTATHLLHKALRSILGNHVEQAGSYVSESRLRFDFTHFEALTDQEIEQAENMVNEKILECLDVDAMNTDLQSAKDMGAMALFGEKYGENVRVVKIGDYSTELCGGTHVANTSQISTFKILSEGGISAGVRRIEAVTGAVALERYKTQDNLMKTLTATLKSTPDNVLKRVEGALKEIKELKSQLDKIKKSSVGGTVDDIIRKGIVIDGITVVISDAGNLDIGGLRDLGDKIKNKLQSGVIVVASGEQGKANLVVMATEDAVKKGADAGKIVKELAPIIGGRGGGKSTMAQAGGKEPEKIGELLKKAVAAVQGMLKC